MEAHRQRSVKTLSVPNCARLLALATLFQGAISGACAAETTTIVSVSELLAHKEKFNGKVVRVSGYISVGMENNTIFSNKVEASTLDGDPKKGIWLNFSEAQYAKSKRFNRTFGQAVGRFKVSDCEGHLCLFGGSLDVVKFVPTVR
jgi:hypothetical protein